MAFVPRRQSQRPPRPSRLTTPSDAERYPNLGAHPATQRALLAHRAMMAGMGRDEALAYVDSLLAKPGQAATRRPRLPAPTRLAAAPTRGRAGGRARATPAPPPQRKRPR